MEKKCPCYVEGKNTEKRMDMSKALFITGTGTDIGKTYVTGLIVKKLAEEGKSAAYYKAAMSGNDRRADGSLIPGDACLCRKYRGLHSRLRKCVLMYMNMHIHRILLHGSRDIRWRWLWSEMATGQYVINMIM